METQNSRPGDAGRSATGQFVRLDSTPLANPYEPPSATDTSSHSLTSSRLAWAAFFAVCALVAGLTRDMPYVSVVVIAAFGAMLLPFVDAADRRRRIWGFVSGLVLAIILPAILLRLTMEPPNTYATVAAYSDRLDSILAFTIPLGVWIGAAASTHMPNGELAPLAQSQKDAEQ